MEILKVTKNDAIELLEIYKPYVEDTAITFEYEVPSVEEFTNRICEYSEKYPYIKAVENGEILGYAYAHAFHSRAAYQWNVETTIYLKKDCKGKGIGRILYEALEEECRKMGILNMNACIATTDTEDEHLTNASVRFHEKMGYSMVGKFHSSGFKFKKWYDMVWMEKIIGEHSSNPSKPNL